MLESGWIYKIKWLKKGLIYFLFLCCLQFQPGLFGQNFGSIAIILPLLLLALMYFLVGNLRFNLIIICSISILPVYQIILYIIGKNLEIQILNACLSLVLGGLVISLLFTYKKDVDFDRAFVQFLSLIAILSILTCIIKFRNILSNIPDLKYPIKNYNSDVMIYCPLAIFYSQYYTFDLFSISLPRLIGVYREPGLMQAFFATGFLMSFLKYSGVYRFSLCFLMIVGMILTNSTAGLVNIIIMPLLVVWVARINNGVKIFSSFLFFGLSVLLAYLLADIDSVGLMDKLSGESGEDRVNALVDFNKNFYDYFAFGLILEGREALIKSTTGSLPLFILRFGIVGFVLSLFPIVFGAKINKYSFAACAPLMVTAISSQPLWGTVPFLAVLLLTNLDVPAKPSAAG